MSVTVNVRAKNLNRIVKRIREYSEAVSPQSPAMRRALTRAALLIVNQAKLNIRKKGLIDTGRLINSMRFEFYKPENTGMGVRIGSFGVPYAAVWEGLLGRTIKIGAHVRTIHMAFGKQIPARAVAVRAHLRHIEPKPFLKPAYETHKYKITALIQEATRA